MITQAWYKKSWWLYLMLPANIIYSIFIFFRRWCYQLGLIKVTHFKVPVIIVGNITVGGTGKTPLTISLADYLVEQGFKPGVVSRGYSGEDNEFPILLNDAIPVSEVGDEAIVMYRNLPCPLVICKNRVAAVKYLLEKADCDVVISDDGLQHYALGRTIEIAVIDGTRQFGNGWQLPVGPLREPKSRLKKVDFVVVNTGPKYNDAFSMQLVGDEIQSVAHPEVRQPLSIIEGKVIHAVAGIGNPQRFFASLRQLGLAIIDHPFPDHYKFKKADLEFGEEAVILMTEKDAVKCKELVDYRAWYLPVKAILPDEFFATVLAKLRKN